MRYSGSKRRDDLFLTANNGKQFSVAIVRRGPRGETTTVGYRFERFTTFIIRRGLRETTARDLKVDDPFRVHKPP